MWAVEMVIQVAMLKDEREDGGVDRGRAMRSARDYVPPIEYVHVKEVCVSTYKAMRGPSSECRNSPGIMRERRGWGAEAVGSKQRRWRSRHAKKLPWRQITQRAVPARQSQ